MLLARTRPTMICCTISWTELVEKLAGCKHYHGQPAHPANIYNGNTPPVARLLQAPARCLAELP